MTINQKANKIFWTLLKKNFEVISQKFGTLEGKKCVFTAVEKLDEKTAKKNFKDSKRFSYKIGETHKIYTPEHKLTAIYCIEN